VGDKPLWRRAFDGADRSLAPRLESFVQTSIFADIMAAGVKVQGQARHRLERQTRRLWHAANLPAGSDVAKLREQVAGLDRQLRLLKAAVDDSRKEHPNADSSSALGAQHPDPPRHGQPGTTRGRAKRAAGP